MNSLLVSIKALELYISKYLSSGSESRILKTGNAEMGPCKGPGGCEKGVLMATYICPLIL